MFPSVMLPIVPLYGTSAYTPSFVESNIVISSNDKFSAASENAWHICAFGMSVPSGHVW